MLRGSRKSEMRSRKADCKLTVNSAIALMGKLIHLTSCHTFLFISVMRISWNINTGSRNGIFSMKSLFTICLFSIYCYEHLIDQATEKALFETLPQDIWAWYTEYLLSDMSLKFLALLPSSNLVVLKKKPIRLKKKLQHRAGETFVLQCILFTVLWPVLITFTVNLHLFIQGEVWWPHG